jgi:hypothetical protein
MDVPAPLLRGLDAWRAALEESIGQDLEPSDPIVVSLAGSNPERAVAGVVVRR